MRISIVTVCKNAEQYIEQTIQSVITQSGDFELEYIVVDGESTDKTHAVIDKYPQIKLVSQKDESMYDALATGFKMVTGDVVAYINADDFYLPGAFSVVAKIFAQQESVDWISGMSVRINDAGEVFYTNLHPGFNSSLIQSGFYGQFLKFIQQESVFFRKELLSDVNYARLSTFQAAGDYYLWHLFAQQHKLYAVEALIGGFRFRDGQISQDISKYWREFDTIRDPRSTVQWIHAFFLKVIDLLFSSRVKKGFFSGFIVYDMKKKRWMEK